jgi:hypothetical protein
MSDASETKEPAVDRTGYTAPSVRRNNVVVGILLLVTLGTAAAALFAGSAVAIGVLVVGMIVLGTWGRPPGWRRDY